MGEGTTTVVPVFEGFVLNHALENSYIAGKEITNILKEEIDLKYLIFNLAKSQSIQRTN